MDTWVCVLLNEEENCLYVALYTHTNKKKLYETLGAALMLIPHQGWVEWNRGKKKRLYIYRHIYIVQNIYRPFVPLKSCSGLAASSALYHVIIIHRLVLMTRGWYDCFFFMSSAFFAINAFCFKIHYISCVRLCFQRQNGKKRNTYVWPDTKTNTLPVEPIWTWSRGGFNLEAISCSNYNNLRSACSLGAYEALWAALLI